MRLIIRILLLVLLVHFSGCTIFQEIAGNGPSVFKGPKEVKNKVKNPVLARLR